MAFGHAVKRGGFDEKLKNIDDLYVEDDSADTSDQQIKGTSGDDSIDGGGGDDVVIGFAGDDTLIGGDGEDDLSGGEGDDTLVGGIVDDLEGVPTFFQDDYSDDYNAEATFEDNGTDTILGYDDDAAAGDGATLGVVDVIDFSDAIDFVDPIPLDGVPTTDLEKEAQLDAILSYQEDPSSPEAGELSDSGGNVWFNVYSNYEGTTAAETVYVEVDGDVFMWTGTNWDLQQDWDIV